jgi:alpha-1,6-mannosyltransferase
MWLWTPLFRAWLRHAYAPVDAVMSVVDPRRDCGRPATLPLLLGVGTAYRPRPGVPRGDHTLYVGRLAREKGVFALLEAAAAAEDPWPLRFVGSGPAEGALRERAGRLGLGRRVSFGPFVHDPERLALAYARARCVVMPGEHETFGLVGLEAAAGGARVVCCTTAPSGRALGDLVHTFPPGDRAGLGAAITAARAAPRRPHAAAALAARFAWPRLFAQELERLSELIG